MKGSKALSVMVTSLALLVALLFLSYPESCVRAVSCASFSACFPLTVSALHTAGCPSGTSCSGQKHQGGLIKRVWGGS